MKVLKTLELLVKPEIISMADFKTNIIGVYYWEIRHLNSCIMGHI